MTCQEPLTAALTGSYGVRGGGGLNGNMSVKKKKGLLNFDIALDWPRRDMSGLSLDLDYRWAELAGQKEAITDW